MYNVDSLMKYTVSVNIHNNDREYLKILEYKIASNLCGDKIVLLGRRKITLQEDTNTDQHSF